MDRDRLFVRVQHQVLPNLSLHAYTSEDGSKKKLFSRFHIVRWTVPVDDENSKMIGWRVMGPASIRAAWAKELVGYESIDFLGGGGGKGRSRCGRRSASATTRSRTCRLIPPNHRERENYKAAQYAPGDYEAIISQRPIAVHALENPTKFDAGLFQFPQDAARCGARHESGGVGAQLRRLVPRERGARPAATVRATCSTFPKARRSRRKWRGAAR